MNELLISKGTKPRRGEVRQCGWCGKDIYVLPCFARRSKKSFCCKDHMLAHKIANTVNIEVPCKVCGVSIITKPSNQKWRPRSTCSKDCNKLWTRKKAEARRQGYTKHQLDRLARYSPEASEWRKEIFVRDDYTCQMCGKRGGYLEADHIKPWAYFPELRFDLDNGRTLCRPCHNTTKINHHKMREIYGDLSTNS